MNNEEFTTTIAEPEDIGQVPHTDEDHRFFYGSPLRFFHASANVAAGVAAEIQVRPASRRNDGYIFLTLIPQKDEMKVRETSGGRKVASFDWNGRKIGVKLGFSDICNLLLVLHREVQQMGEGRGLLHDSKDATTVIYFEQNKDRPGVFSLCLSRKSKSGGDVNRLRISFSAVEALGLRLFLEQALGPVACGIAHE